MECITRGRPIVISRHIPGLFFSRAINGQTPYHNVCRHFHSLRQQVDIAEPISPFNANTRRSGSNEMICPSEHLISVYRRVAE